MLRNLEILNQVCQGGILSFGSMEKGQKFLIMSDIKLNPINVGFQKIVEIKKVEPCIDMVQPYRVVKGIEKVKWDELINNNILLTFSIFTDNGA